MNKKQAPFRIDVHHHIAPVDYIEGLRKEGISNAGGAPIHPFEVNQTLEMMDRHEIEVAITSVSAPGVYLGNQSLTKKLARICNDYSAKLISDYPDRFGTFASLPLPFIEDTLKEIEYADEQLNVDGFVLMTNYDGIYPGDKKFDEVFQELNKRKANVFIHPVVPPNGGSLINIPEFTLEFVFDTTRAVTNLLASGTLERYPDISFILSHAGGAVPYLSWRIARGVLATRGMNSKEKVERTEEVIHLLKKLYYDTALSTVPYVFTSLEELVPNSQILFGSDYPFANEDVTKFSINSIDNYFNSDDKINNIYRENTINLFSRF